MIDDRCNAVCTWFFQTQLNKQLPQPLQQPSGSEDAAMLPQYLAPVNWQIKTMLAKNSFAGLAFFSGKA